MSSSSFYFHASIQFILSGSFRNSIVKDDQQSTFLLDEKQLKYFISSLLKDNNSYLSIKRIDLSNFMITKMNSIISVCNLMKVYNINELIIDFKFIKDYYNIPIELKEIILNLKLLDVRNISPKLILDNINSENKLEHLFIEDISNFDYKSYVLVCNNVFKNLKTLHCSISNKQVGGNFKSLFKYLNKIEELNIQFLLTNDSLYLDGLDIILEMDLELINLFLENGKHLNNLNISTFSNVTLFLKFSEQEKNTILEIIKDQPIFPKLKELYLNTYLSKDSNSVLKYIISNQSNSLNKLTMKYESYNEYIDLIFSNLNTINELTLIGRSSLSDYYNIDYSGKKLIINKLITKQLRIDELQYLNLLNGMKLLKEIYILSDSQIIGAYESFNKFNSIKLSLETIYLYKCTINRCLLEFLIKKSETNLNKLSLFKTNIENREEDVKKEFEKIKILRNTNEIKNLEKLRYLKLDDCRGRYDLIFIYLLRYNFPLLNKLFINQCYSINHDLLEYSFTVFNMSNLIELELYGCPFDDNLMLKMFQFIENNRNILNNGIKLCLEGNITEQGLLQIPKQFRNKIVELKLLNSTINLNTHSTEIIEFLNDLSNDLTICCLNFREFGPTKEIFKVISNKFKDLRILNIQGNVENTITKEDVIQLIDKLDKIELVYLNCIKNFTAEEVETFRMKIRLQQRSAPKLIIPIKKVSNSSSKNSGCNIF
ncbi:hypothetical protein ABK040_011928 [Willaertia magna]